MKNFNKIATIFILILKKTVLSILVRPVCIKAKNNMADMDNSVKRSSSRINNKIANFLCNIKKISSKTSFFITKASLAFTKWRQIFIIVVILYYFDPKHHILIKTNALCYNIYGILSQLTSKTGLVSQIIYKPNLET